MDVFEARHALSELSRKLVLLRGERHKDVRNNIIDSMLGEDGSISCLDEFIKERIEK